MRFDPSIPEIEWRDITPPGSKHEVHGAPSPKSPDQIVYRHRLRAAPLLSEPRSNHTARGPWTRGLPRKR